MKLHHLGFVVSHPDDISDSILEKELLHEVIDPIQNARISVYHMGIDCLLECIVPLSPQSTVYGFLKKNGSGFHHFCYSCNMAEMEAHATKHRLIKVMGPVLAPVFNNRTVFFYVSRNNRITEFILD